VHIENNTWLLGDMEFELSIQSEIPYLQVTMYPNKIIFS